MRRREFITLAVGAIAWPLAARAQQQAMPVVGYLDSGAVSASAPLLVALRQGLAEAGYVAGRYVAIDWRGAEDRYERLPELAASLVRRSVSVIFANNPAAPVAKAATTTIPIVFAVGVDPVATGLVASLNHPGGNLTGFTTLNVEMGPKRLQLLHEIVPTAAILGLLVNPANPNSATLTRELEAAARVVGVQMKIFRAGSEKDLEAVFATLSQSGVGGLVIGADAFFNSRGKLLAALTTRHAMPAINQYREFAAAGGLMSYGSSLTGLYRQAGLYIGRILKGEKPADLPVQQVTNVEFIINLKTAKALGLSVPLPLLGRADEVIE